MKRNAFFLTIFTLNLAFGTARANQVDDNTTAASSVRANAHQEVRDLQPFTHVAWIPADSDENTIRFKGAKLVQVPTTITYTMNPKYCEELAFQDPGGSMYCPYTQTGSPTAAYQVTYSYIGPPLASDESATRNFTFDVYFRVDELPPAAKAALTGRTRDRADLAGYFTVETLRKPVQQVVIDEARSRFCAGSYVDGAWTHSDANCKDEIVTKSVALLDDYLTVRVEPVPAQARVASAPSHNNHHSRFTAIPH